MKAHTLLITGGHPTPALAVIDECAKNFPNIKVVFAGRKYANQKESLQTYEYDEIIQRSITFIPVAFMRGWSGLVSFPQSFITSLQILKKYRPNAILSFGGYVALPFVCAARLCRLPVYTHEQTAVMGTANRLISALSQKVFLSFPNTKIASPKYVYTGNPIRRQILVPPATSPLDIPYDKPILLITGGNLGSHSINTMIFPILQQLLKTFTVVHQTGNIQAYGDYESALKVKRELDENLRLHYVPLPYLSTDAWSYILSKCSMVISRSGANTFIELVAAQKPCVLIPLPWSAHGEQRKHAQILQEAGVGEICEQTTGTTNLYETIMRVFDNRSKYIEKYPTLQHLYVPDAANSILKAIVFSAAKAFRISTFIKKPKKV